MGRSSSQKMERARKEWGNLSVLQFRETIALADLVATASPGKCMLLKTRANAPSWGKTEKKQWMRQMFIGEAQEQLWYRSKWKHRRSVERAKVGSRVLSSAHLCSAAEDQAWSGGPVRWRGTGELRGTEPHSEGWTKGNRGPLCVLRELICPYLFNEPLLTHCPKESTHTQTPVHKFITHWHTTHILCLRASTHAAFTKLLYIHSLFPQDTFYYTHIQNSCI